MRKGESKETAGGGQRCLLGRREWWLARVQQDKKGMPKMG